MAYYFSFSVITIIVLCYVFKSPSEVKVIAPLMVEYVENITNLVVEDDASTWAQESFQNVNQKYQSEKAKMELLSFNSLGSGFLVFISMATVQWKYWSITISAAAAAQWKYWSMKVYKYRWVIFFTTLICLILFFWKFPSFPPSSVPIVPPKLPLTPLPQVGHTAAEIVNELSSKNAARAAQQIGVSVAAEAVEIEKAFQKACREAKFEAIHEGAKAVAAEASAEAFAEAYQSELNFTRLSLEESKAKAYAAYHTNSTTARDRVVEAKKAVDNAQVVSIDTAKAYQAKTAAKKARTLYLTAHLKNLHQRALIL